MDYDPHEHYSPIKDLLSTLLVFGIVFSVPAVFGAAIYSGALQ